LIASATFELVTPAGELPPTYALDRMITWMVSSLLKDTEIRITYLLNLTYSVQYSPY